MRTFLLTLLFYVSLSGVSRGESEAPKPPDVPPDSMIQLEALATAIASTNDMEVKSLEIRWSVCHPNDRPGASIQFQEKPLGDDVYEFASVTLTNSNWGRWELNKNETDWAIMPPASLNWAAWGEVEKYKRLKIQLDGEQIFIGMGDGLNANQIRSYLEEFTKWINENPSLMEHQFKYLSGIGIPPYGPQRYENKSVICFYFAQGHSGVGYSFEIINDRLVFINKWRWTS
jgi:hypothetical protein